VKQRTRGYMGLSWCFGCASFWREVMLMARIHRLLLVASLMGALVVGCGGHDESTPTKRIARQDLSDQTLSLTQYWLYVYDANGRTTQTVGYDGAGNVEDRVTLAYAGNLRQTSSLADASGNILSVTDYTYDSGVLTSATQRMSNGDVAETREYVFDAGRKDATLAILWSTMPQRKRGVSGALPGDQLRRVFITVPSAARTSMLSAGLPSACVEQLRQGSYARITAHTRFRIPSVTWPL
jgi:hypothetical protein